jgi:hypothetical protein
VLRNGKRPDASGAFATRNRGSVCLARSYSRKAERIVTELSTVALYQNFVGIVQLFLKSSGNEGKFS